MMLTVAGTGTGSMVDALAPGAALLRFMVTTSVLTWARDPELKRYGWWAEPFGESIGSLLWKLGRESNREDLKARVVATVETSLQWLKRRGLADDIYVQVSTSEDRLWLKVTVRRGDAVIAIEFDDLWKAVLSAP